MRDKIRHVVAAGIQMELVRDLGRIQRLVQLARAAIETVKILSAAVKINFRLGEQCGVFAGQHERAVQIPDSSVDGIAEDMRQDLCGQVAR